MAVLRTGAAFTLIDPSHPYDRIQSMLQETRARILLISPAVSSAVTGQRNGVEHITKFTETLFDAFDVPARLSLPMVEPTNAAVVLFTPGSTGKPKGIIQEHITAAFSAQTCGKTFGIGKIYNQPYFARSPVGSVLLRHECHRHVDDPCERSLHLRPIRGNEDELSRDCHA